MEKLQEKVRKLTSASGAVAAIAAVLTMVGVVIAGFQGYSDSRQQKEAAWRAMEQTELAKRNAMLAEKSRQQAQDLQRQVEALQNALQNASHTAKGEGRYSELSPVDRHLLDQLKAEQDELARRMGTLENVLANTPEKALALPMMKQQVDNLQDRTHSDLDGVRGEIGRLFTLTQWFIGLMFTIALGVFGLALSNIRRGDRPKAD
jgi:chromosome segregation ATPase